MAIDMYDTRTMLEALEIRFPPQVFLKDMFFSKETIAWPSRSVDIDVKVGRRRLAPYVAPTAEGKVVERIGFNTFTYTPPYIKEKMPTTSQDFLQRNMGETVYTANDGPTQRAQKQLGKDMAELEDMIVRREETQAAELLDTGIVTIVGDGISDTIDFLMPASHRITLAGADLWTNAASNPLEDLRAAKRILVRDSGLNPDKCIMGSDVLDAFLANANVVNQLDTRRIDLGKIEPIEESDAVTFYGRIRDVSIDLYTYEEYYINPGTSNLRPMVPVDKFFLGSTRARCSVNYGAIQDLDVGGLFAVPRFPKSWRTKDPSVQWLLMQSAPLLAMHQPTAFMSVQAV